MPHFTIYGTDLALTYLSRGNLAKLLLYVQACDSIGIAMSMPPTAVLSGLASIMSFMRNC